MKVAISDGEMETKTTVTFQVMAADAQMIAADGFFEFEGSSLQGNLTWLDPDSSDVQGQIEIIQDVSNGTLVIDPSQDAFVYTPNANFSGDDEFQFRVVKGNRLSNVGKVRIVVKDTNQNPFPCRDDKCELDPCQSGCDDQDDHTPPVCTGDHCPPR